MGHTKSSACKYAFLTMTNIQLRVQNHQRKTMQQWQGKKQCTKCRSMQIIDIIIATVCKYVKK